MTHLEMIQALAEAQRDLNQAATLISQLTTKLAAVTSQLMENQRSAPTPTPAPAPAAQISQDQPTVEAAVSLQLDTGPTPETVVPAEQTRIDQAELRRREQLGHFVGTGSLVARFLSPEVIIGGKGFLKPGVAELEQYKNDVTKMAPQRLYDWPTGFYRDAVTSGRLFMVNTSKAMVIYNQLPEAEAFPIVVLKSPIPAEQKSQSVDALPIMELLILKEALEKELRALSDKA